MSAERDAGAGGARGGEGRAGDASAQGRGRSTARNAKRGGGERGATPPALTWIALALILFAGGLLRASYLRELVTAPDYAAPLADAAFHDYWARALASGDWAPPAGETNPRIQEVPFLRPPGYPYFLAAIYKIAGPGYLGPRIAQMALGLATCVLAFLLGRVLIGTAAGLILAAFAAVYWGQIYFEGELQANVLITALGFGVLLALARWVRAPSLRLAIAGGALTGLLALVQPTALLFIPAALAWMLWARRPRPIAHAGAFALTAALAILPATARNLIVAREPVLISSNGAVNLWIGNNPGADGVKAEIPDLQELTGMKGWSWFSYDEIVRALGQRENRKMSYRDASSYFTRRALDWIAQNPLAFLELCGRRALLFWGPDEISNNKADDMERRNSATLRWLPTLPVALALALAGVVALVMRRRGAAATRGAPAAAGGAQPAATRDAPAAVGSEPLANAGLVLVALFIATYFLSFVPVLVAGRFRSPLAPIVFVFGAYALYRAGAWIAERDWSRAGAVAASAVLLFFVCRISTHDSAVVDEAWWRTDRGLALARAGKTTEAISEFRAALAANPGFVDAHLHLAGALVAQGNADEAIAHYQDVARNRPTRADVRMRLGVLLRDRGRHAEAARELREVVKLDASSREAHFELGRALLGTQEYDGATAAFRASLALNAKQPLAHVNIGIALAKQGRHDDAIATYEEALRIDAFSADALYRLALSRRDLGALDDAEKAFQQAIRIEPTHTSAMVDLGGLYHRRGQFDEAARWFNKAIETDPRNMTARFNLAAALGSQGRIDEAVATLEAAVAADPQNQVARQRLDMMRRAKTAPPGGAKP